MLTRELVQCGNDLVSEKHDAGRGQVGDLVDDKRHPRLDDKVATVQCDECHEVLGVDQVGRGSGKDPAAAAPPARDEGEKATVLARRDGRNPVVLFSASALIQCTSAFKPTIPPSVGYAETNSANEAPRKHCSIHTRMKP